MDSYDQINLNFFSGSIFKKIFIKENVVYRCSKVINILRKNKSVLQSKTEENTSNIRGKQRYNVFITIIWIHIIQESGLKINIYPYYAMILLY